MSPFFYINIFSSIAQEVKLMRWFFLFFLMLLAIVGNMAILDKISLIRILSLGVFNLFVISLLGIWWQAYFRQKEIGAKEPFAAMILLVAGLSLMLIGVQQAIANNCEILISQSRPHGLRNIIVQTIESTGYCRELGFVIVILGLYMSARSIKMITFKKK